MSSDTSFRAPASPCAIARQCQAAEISENINITAFECVDIILCPTSTRSVSLSINGRDSFCIGDMFSSRGQELKSDRIRHRSAAINHGRAANLHKHDMLLHWSAPYRDQVSLFV